MSVRVRESPCLSVCETAARSGKFTVQKVRRVRKVHKKRGFFAVFLKLSLFHKPLFVIIAPRRIPGVKKFERYFAVKRLVALIVMLAVVAAVTAGAAYKFSPTETATAPPQAAVSSDTVVFTYGIRTGDSLSLIARRFGVSFEDIKKANPTPGGVIYSGDILGVPLKRKALVFLHTVEKGETLTSIARDYETTVVRLKQLNRMSGETVYESQKLAAGGAGSDSRFVVLEVGGDDTPDEIARAFGMDLRDIEKMNFSNPLWREPGSHVLIDTFNYSYSERTRADIVETARAYLGAPYKFGGNSTETGIDCSAYVKKVFSYFGVNLPRTVRMMHKHAEGMWIAKNQLQTGDLVFFETDRPFPSHIGIYVGGGNFIHASSAYKEVVVSPLDKPYYTKTYIGAKRIYIKDPFAVASGEN